jgi:FkbH-like protein
METATPVRKSALSELRALKRSGIGEAVGRVQELLHEMNDVLDLEAAGALLRGPKEREQLAAAGFRTQRIALLGSSTLDSLPNLLTSMLVQNGVLPEVKLAGFNQWRFEIFSGAPELKPLSPRIVACLLDDQAIFEQVAHPLDLAEIEARCEAFPAEVSQWVETCQQVLGGLVVLCTIPLSSLRRDRFIDYRSKARLAAAWGHMNAKLLGLAAKQSRLIVLDVSSISAAAGAAFSADRMRHVAGHAFSPEFLRAYTAELVRISRADLGLAKKCLVLDLDNTLWGGVVGDDGVSALRLGGSYPGSAHKELQLLARDLMAQGVMLTVCSKNDEAIAREALATHPEMVLKPDAFVAITANWQPKPDNVRAQAAQLNIGLDAMVFADDNPTERGLMRCLLPQVATVELPADPASYAAHLAARGDFNLLELTEEDRSRTVMYQAQAQRAELERSATNIEEYLVSLGSQLTLEPLGPLNAGRIVQLFAKTNQFNMTGRRYSEEEVTRRHAQGSGAVFGARLTDRFGDNGLIAAFAIGKDADGAWAIDNVVLSCRVFSRNVENAIIGLILRAAQAQGAPAVAAQFIETAKNQKFSGFYSSLGFAETSRDNQRTFRHELQQLPEMPRWVQLSQGTEIFHAL